MVAVWHVGDLEHFHFHLLRHTFTSNLLASGAPPKDVQGLLGHSAVSTTMNIYAHATREAKRNSVRLLDKVAGTIKTKKHFFPYNFLTREKIREKCKIHRC